MDAILTIGLAPTPADFLVDRLLASHDRAMFDWIWPTVCCSCAMRSPLLVCARCGPGSILRPPSQSQGIDTVFSVDRYERPVGRALRRAKLQGDRTQMVRLARLFAASLEPVVEGARFDAVVPAPSRWQTRVQRGFSGAAVLAKVLGRRLGVPVVHGLRSTARTKLARLDATGRRATLAGRLRSVRDVPGHVLLVDDVLTTGATAEACALELIGGCTDRVTLATLCVVSRS